MKKMLYAFLPALILSVCATSAFAQASAGAIKVGEDSVKVASTHIKGVKESLNGVLIFRDDFKDAKLTQKLEELKRANQDSLDSMTKFNKAEQIEKDTQGFLKATKIAPGEKIDLQGMLFNEEHRETAETKYYKLELAKDAEYVFIDQKTSQKIEGNALSWKWNDFLGKYEYLFDFRLLLSKTSEPSYLLIKITPVLSKDNEPTLPVIHIAFNFNEKGDITYGGHAYAIDGHGGFYSKLAIKVK